MTEAARTYHERPILSCRRIVSLVQAAAASLSVTDLSVGALHGIRLQVAPGEILALSGASGSGKSRLLRAISDLDPHVGHAALGDVARAGVAGHVWRRRVMLVPADSQWWADTVGEHFPAQDTAAWQALGFPAEAAGWQVSRLSSGERQRLALLRAVAHRPSALLLDEPTANLDGEATARVERWLCDLSRQHGWPVIWVSHDPAQIQRVADRHLRIHQGGLEVAA